MNEQVDQQQTATASPGWYHDSAGSLRWWDGRAWTENVAPQQMATAPPGPAAPAPSGSGVSGLAVIALLIGFLPALGCVALPLGVVALKRIRTTGQRGRIPAIVGITFGSLWVLNLILQGLVIAKYAS
jgi:hypothetical protein